MADANRFWGVEVKGKESCKVRVDIGDFIYVTQVTLCDINKDNEPVIVHVQAGDKKLVMGTLSQKITHISLYLVFNADFEISHNWNKGSIHLMGYQSVLEGSDMEFDFSEASIMPKRDEDHRNDDDNSKDGEDKSDDDDMEMVTFDSEESYESSSDGSDSKDDTTPVKSF